MLSKLTKKSDQRNGFSLIEVVLAIGIFLVTILALVGLLGPTLQSVEQVEQVDEISSVVNTVNAFLQSSPDIGNASATPPVSKFDAIYGAIASDDSATIFVFRRYIGTGTDVELIVGFQAEDSVSPAAELSGVDFSDAAGPIYRVILSASSVTPDASLDSTSRNGDGIYTLSTADPSVYPEGYLAIEVRIFVEEPPAPGATFDVAKDVDEFVDIEPIFTYNTAVVR